MLRFISILVVFALTTGAASLSAQAPARLADSVRSRVDAVFARWDHTDTPGCALGIADHGRVVYERGYGMADLQHGLAITPTSIFHVASISKEFTAFAVGLLAEEGRLALDDDIRKYVPEVPEYGARITIRHLIHHVSGLRDQWQLLAYAGWRQDDLITEGDVLDIVSRQKGTNFPPGAEYVYSNTGYTLLAVIVKRISGKSLRQFAQDRIFEPLGMPSTHFHDDHTMIVPGRTAAYVPRAGGGWSISIPVFDTYGATSLFTTPRDLLTWMANLDTPKVGSAALIATMQTSAVLTDGNPANYGFGLSIGRYRGLRVVGHGGADAGYRAQIERYPERGIGIAVLCNASNSGPGVLARRVADALLGNSAPPEVVPIDTTPRAVAPNVIAQWVGTYRDTIGHAVLRVVLRHDTLTLGGTQRLVPTSDTSARIAGTASGVVFRSVAGQVTGVTTVPPGTRVVFFQRENAFNPDRSTLAAYAGEYVSDELDVRYRLVLGDSGLVVKARRIDDIALQPAWRDAFSARGASTIEFSRDKQGRIDGFTITDGRVRGVRFQRVK